jgi:hypothetical protein
MSIRFWVSGQYLLGAGVDGSVLAAYHLTLRVFVSWNAETEPEILPDSKLDPLLCKVQAEDVAVVVELLLG